MELQADPEHEEDDSDLGQLVGQVLVGDEAGRIGADDESRDEVPHDGGEPETKRRIAADEGGGQPAGQRQDQVDFVHGPSITGPVRSRSPGSSIGPPDPPFRKLNLTSILLTSIIFSRGSIFLNLAALEWMGDGPDDGDATGLVGDPG
jgi:hypothetical protein